MVEADKAGKVAEEEDNEAPRNTVNQSISTVHMLPNAETPCSVNLVNRVNECNMTPNYATLENNTSDIQGVPQKLENNTSDIQGVPQLGTTTNSTEKKDHYA